jgi:hypothetical protein
MKLFINHLNYVCIHNAYTLPEGFEGDALILDESHPRASALEQSSRSTCLCHWAKADLGLLILSLYAGAIALEIYSAA